MEETVDNDDERRWRKHQKVEDPSVYGRISLRVEEVIVEDGRGKKYKTTKGDAD